ncbi:hypothetical protein Tco_1171192 [Tanacetum coccineum]
MLAFKIGHNTLRDSYPCLPCCLRLWLFQLILDSSDSSEDSVGSTTIGQEFCLVTISTTIPTHTYYTPASPDYSPASDSESDPSEDPSSDHIPPVPATSPLLSSDDDPTDSDTPDTPLSPTHDTPFTEITASTQRSPTIPHRRVMLLASGQPIPYGRPYPHLNVPVHHDRPRGRGLDHYPLSRLAERHATRSFFSIHHQRHHHISFWMLSSILLETHIVRSFFTRFTEVLLRYHARDKELEDSGYLAEERNSDPEVQQELTVYCLRRCSRDRGIDAESCKDIPEPAQEGSVEVTYETLGDLVQRFHDHTPGYPNIVKQAIEEFSREQGHRIVGVESAVMALTREAC